ncbi:MAG: alpha/beta fold hydrolase, partial [Pseudomonadota bacterium]
MNDGATVALADGRRLGYAVYGDPAGFPVLYFHGCPGSRLEASLLTAAAVRQRVRVIAVDRPGYGLSAAKPGRRITDWPQDIADLAERLGLERFSILGASGGGPYALACALRLEKGLHRVGLAAGLAPFGEGRQRLTTRLGLLLARAFFPLIDTVLPPIVRRHPGWPVAILARLLSAPDRTLLQRPEVADVFRRSLREAFRQGGGGAHRDMMLYGQPWGFDLGEIALPLTLWHGEADRLLSPRMCRQQARALPHAVAHYVPGEGHFSLPINSADEMLRHLR